MVFTSEHFLSKSALDLRNGAVGMEEYITSVCDRIEATDPFIHAFLPEPGRKERLIREASELKKKYPDLQHRPPLFCIPVGVKDIFRTDGFPTKAGSRLPEYLFSGKESSVVSSLKKAGALIAGKTVTTEFAFFEPGPTTNPYDQLHTPGGSSSGSAAAVACGFVPLSLGTQTIGSIIRPASFCGVYGFKPSYQCIPVDGIIPFSASADHVGFFTQDLAGIELTASILCSNWKPLNDKPDRMPVIGVAVGNYLEQADKEILTFFESQIFRLEAKGCKIIRLDVFGDIESINIAHRSMVAAELAGVHEEWFARFEGLYGKKTKELILEGKEVKKEAYEHAKNGTTDLRAELESLMITHGIDLWLSPSSSSAAPHGLDSTGSPIMNLPWTYAGVPVISVPSGFNASGLPLGLQFAGIFMEDERLLGWINCIEKIQKSRRQN